MVAQFANIPHSKNAAEPERIHRPSVNSTRRCMAHRRTVVGEKRVRGAERTNNIPSDYYFIRYCIKREKERERRRR